MSATPDSTLADPKDHLVADLQLQLAKCRADRAEALAERDEALAQQAATAEILQVINSSPGDLKPVFDAMLERILRLCDAPAGYFFRYEQGKYTLAAARGLTAPFAEYLTHMDQPTRPKGAVECSKAIRMLTSSI
jgi:hypothetical protein